MSAALSIVPPAANVLLEAAMECARRGLRVVPVHTVRKDGTCSCGNAGCATPGKHPCVPEWQTRGTTDVGLIRIWFSGRWEGANIGIVTGARSGVIVLDEDPRNGGDDSLDVLIYRYGRLPDTLVAMTGGGGNHHYFQHPGGVIGNKVSLLPGLDIKGDDGLAIAPPSVHASGGVYDWDGIDGLDAPIAPAPDWLVNLIRAGCGEVSADVSKTGTPRTVGKVIPDGQRNDTLASIAGYLRRLGATQETILAAIMAVNAAQCRPPLPDKELRAIAKSITRYRPEGEDLKDLPADFSDLQTVIAAMPTTMAPLLTGFREEFPEIWFRRKPMRVDGWFPYALSIATHCAAAGMSHSQIAAIVAEHQREQGRDGDPLSVADYIRLLAKAHRSRGGEGWEHQEAADGGAIEQDEQKRDQAQERQDRNEMSSEPERTEPKPHEEPKQEHQHESAEPKDGVKSKSTRKQPRSSICFITNEKGQIRPLLANAELMLRKEWSGVLAYNEFALSVTTAKRPPGMAAGQTWPGSKVGEPWTDHDDRLAAIWLQRHGVLVSDEIAGKAVQTVARDVRIHPVREYLESLKWDGTPRLYTWPSTYLGAPKTAYTAAVGSRWMVSGAARIDRPGVKADHVIVLSGRQGIGKTTVFRILGGPFYTDELAPMGDKDASMQLRGAWIIELAELESLARADVERVKAFLSRTTDRYRPPYGRHVIEVPRQCIFCGTVNRSDYLRDDSGNRRFWPIDCGRIDLSALERDRDQLWAESYALYKGGEHWWLDSCELNEAAAVEQDEHMEIDPWEVHIAAALEIREDNARNKAWHELQSSAPAEASIGDLLMFTLNVPVERQTRAHEMRVAGILRRFGWVRRRGEKASGGGRRWVYRKMVQVGPNHGEVGTEDGTKQEL